MKYLLIAVFFLSGCSSFHREVREEFVVGDTQFLKVIGIHYDCGKCCENK